MCASNLHHKVLISKLFFFFQTACFDKLLRLNFSNIVLHFLQQHNQRVQSTMIKQIILSFVVPYLIFSTVLVVSARVPVEQNRCSSSCGLLSIRYPVRLQSDPDTCGEPDYELICNGNKTILQLNSSKYYVTDISYTNDTLHILDANLADCPCGIPFMFPYDEFRKKNYQINYYNWVLFVNCSKKIESSSYLHIPCLSEKNTFVYGIVGATIMDEIFPSCSVLSVVPIETRIQVMSSKTDVLQLVRKGYSIGWGYKLTEFQLIRPCLGKASEQIKSDNEGRSDFNILLLYPFTFTSKYLGCLYTKGQYDSVTSYKGRFYDIYGVPYILIVLFDIVIELIVIAIVTRFILAPLFVYAFLANEYWKTMVPVDSIEKFLRNQETLSPTRYAYTDIIVMTNHFKEKLGQGGFGSVYKGEILGGHQVAVKMLGNSKCNGDEFINEVATIGRIHHLNVVRLVGFCSEGSKRGLVYEFMPNGSLDKHIFSSTVAERRFTAEKLNEIALGVARGIEYLHMGCDMRILHFDIKPQNILLDHNFNPKVADFGLAKLCPKEHSLVSISVARGTIGFMAPELVSRSFGIISNKSDVYSFGMLLMEMAGCRRNIDHKADNSSQVYYPSWIYDQLQQSELPEISNSFKIDDMERKLCKVGLCCIQMRPSDRPSMSSVIEMLEADVDALPLPPKPFMTVSQPLSTKESFTYSFSSELSAISEDE